ncbi:lipopolysaccharide biosynthesis protein [Staphylococcus simulans]|uniref:lipopolysaccharide biosynthesis protein n=1 Tax=Staphylococcus simulans TaxID=1286 RepID=UPI00399C47F4
MKRFLHDSSINIISNLIIVAIIQLVTFPLVSKIENERDFAELIVYYGIVLIFATTFGNTLNNVRLLHNPNLEENIKNQVFSKYFSWIIIFNLIFFLIMFLFSDNGLGINQLVFCVFAMLLTSRYYLQVYFREDLRYISILMTNIYVVLGYTVGVAIYYFVISFYALPFFIGETFGFIYLITKTKVRFQLKNKVKITANGILKDYINFSSINLIINVLNYLDRLILLPIIGPAAVTVYFIGSTASKMISLVTTPMNNVILSYLSLRTDSVSAKNFKKLLNFLLIIILPCFFVIKYASLLVIYIIYRNYFDRVLSIIDLITLIGLVSILNSIIHPFAMKVLNSRLLLFIQLGYALIYLLLAVIGSINYNLVGFCIATIVAMVIKLIYTNLKISKAIKYN